MCSGQCLRRRQESRHDALSVILWMVVKAGAVPLATAIDLAFTEDDDADADTCDCDADAAAYGGDEL